MLIRQQKGWRDVFFVIQHPVHLRHVNTFYLNPLVAAIGLYCRKGYFVTLVRTDSVLKSNSRLLVIIPFPSFAYLSVYLQRREKAPWFKSWEGKIYASLLPGTLGYDPAPYFDKAVWEGRKTQLRLIAHPLKPDMICRFLLKMGIEVVAWDNRDDVFCPKFDEARQFALTGKKAGKWWYLQRERVDIASHFVTHGFTKNELNENVQMKVVRLDGEQEIFHLTLLYLDMFVPLTSKIMPKVEGLEEPEYQLFWV